MSADILSFEALDDSLDAFLHWHVGEPRLQDTHAGPRGEQPRAVRMATGGLQYREYLDRIMKYLMNSLPTWCLENSIVVRLHTLTSQEK